MVLGFHSSFATGFPQALTPAYHWLFDGSLGVHCFFVISGFLITWLMLQEKARTGSVSLGNFYARRALRILPVYCAYLAVLAAIQWFGIDRQSTVSWIGNLTFTRNVFGNDPVSGQLWSLSVEEQFYFLWPGLLLLLVGRRNNFRAVMFFITFLILLGPLFRGLGVTWLTPQLRSCLASMPAVFNSLLIAKSIAIHFLIEFDAIAFGCLGAVLFARRREAMEAVLKNRPAWTFAVGAALIAVPHIFTRLSLYPGATIQFGNSLQESGFLILLLQSLVMPGWNLYRALNWAWVRQLGVLSYSVYIWQQLFWDSPRIPGMNRVWWMGLWIVPLLAVAAASYYGLERPLLELRSRYRKLPLAGGKPKQRLTS